MSQPSRRIAESVLSAVSIGMGSWLLLAWLAPDAQAQQSLARFDAPVVVGSDTTRFEALLDLDGDGDSDAIDWLWTNTNGMQVRVGGWINDGNGALSNAWNVPLTFATTVVATGQDSAVGDLDGDARDDFALSFGDRIYLYTSNGAAPPAELALLELPAAGLSIALADFDGDGRDDLASSDGAVTIWLNTPGNGFQPAEPAWDTIGTSLLDDLQVVHFDGDGVADLADIGDGTVYFYTLVDGQKTGTAGLPHALNHLNMLQLATGDVDADGDDDAVVFDVDENRCTVLRQGRGGWSNEPVQEEAGPASHLADVNGDGALDGVGCAGELAVEEHGGGGPTANTTNNVNSPFAVALNDGTGDFAAAFGIPALGSHHLAGVADLDDDGDADLVGGRSIYYAIGPLDAPPQATVSLQPLEISALDGFTDSNVSDFNGDGDPDVLFGLDSVVANAGDSSFTLQATGYPPVPGLKKWLGPGVQGDFDGDGDVDLLVTRWQGLFTAPLYLDSYVLRNNGSGVLAQAVLANDGSFNPSPGTITVWDDPEASLVADAEGDGDLDLFLFNAEKGGNTRLSLNDGSGYFTLAADFSEGRVQHVVPLNADALPDLVIVSNVLRVRLGTGGGTFGPAVVLPTIPSYGDRVAVLDVDGNGALDVVACEAAGGVIEVHLNDGFGNFSLDGSLFAAYHIYSAFLSWPRRMVAVDANVDGTQDLVAFPAGGSVHSSWVLVKDSGGGWTAVQQVFVPGGVADFDGDGDDDVISQQVQASVGPSRVVESLAFSGDEVGLRRQYGSGTPGTGGVVPVLGASGPFREGETAALHITGLPALKLGIVTVGLTESALPNTPWLGSTAWNWPWLLYFTLVSPAGQPGVAGSASFVLPFEVPTGLAGVGNLYHQVWWADTGAMFNRSSSNGLLIDYD